MFLAGGVPDQVRGETKQLLKSSVDKSSKGRLLNGLSELALAESGDAVR